MLSSVRGLFAGPWVVPAEQPIDLVFFQRVFSTLCRRREFRERLAQDASVAASTHGHPSSAFLWEQDDPVSTIDEAASQDADSQLVPFVEFERAMVRVRRVIHDVSAHDLTKYDVDQDGYVSWFEFCLCCQSHGIRAKLSIAERIFLTLEDSSSSVLGRWVSILVFAAVLVSIFTFVASTVPHGEMQNLCKLASDAGYDETCRPAPKEMFGTADFVCVMFFTVEYGLRLLLSTVVRAELCDRERTRLLEWVTSDEVVHFPSAVQRLLEFVAAPSNLVDLFAIMPWYIEQVSDQGRENAIIQLIRLTRVIRAFRLGRRLEAVIIIVRSLKRSIRAVRVLVLNLILGMLIFGSLMFMAEQGEWDPEKQYFVRVVGTAWDDESRTWQRVMEKSPFDSIPACFWWAIVTATTVGYGDDYTPTTILGKLVAGVTMVWSLCVVALPIGVIGGNFESVWQQYDQEKKREWAMQRKQQAIADQSVGLVDPLISPRTIVLEVWHDSGLPFPDGRGNQGELLGEASCVLDLPPSEAIAGRRIAAQLRPSPMGARRRARGQVSFEYSWSPTAGPCHPGRWPRGHRLERRRVEPLLRRRRQAALLRRRPPDARGSPHTDVARHHLALVGVLQAQLRLLLDAGGRRRRLQDGDAAGVGRGGDGPRPDGATSGDADSFTGRCDRPGHLGDGDVAGDGGDAGGAVGRRVPDAPREVDVQHLKSLR